MHEKHYWIRSLTFLTAAILLPFAVTAEQTPMGDPINTEWLGPYVKGGVNIGAVEIDSSRVDTDAGGGVALALGYRALPWLAGEFQFDYLGGSTIEVSGTDVADGNYFDFTFNAKAFPVPLLNDHVLERDLPLVKWLEPYALLGIGGGEFEFDGKNGRSTSNESTFVVRLGLGVDFLMAQHWGVSLDGGFHFTTDDDLDDADILGVGIFNLGVFWRF